MHWKCTVVLVCVFGVLKKFRPGTPFLTPFLESPDFKNFTNQQVNSQIYPYWTYANLISMVPIFFTIDFMRYKPILVLEAISLLSTWILLLYGTNLFHMQLMQISFGVATSADIAYYSYLYAMVRKKHYPRITSYIRTASMVGKFFAYSLGQFLVSTNLGDYLLLNQLTLIPAILIVPISLILPLAKPVKASSNDQQQLDEIKSKKEEQAAILVQGGEEKRAKESVTLFKSFGNRIEKNVISHYRNPIVFRWSFWSILVQCGIFQVMNFVQTLWAHRQVEKEQILNGFVESANTLLAAFAVFLLQFIPLRWERHELLVFVGCSLFISALLYAMIHFANIFLDYILYSLLYALFNMLMAISSNLIATNLNSQFYGLVFGLNSFITVLMETMFTLIIVDGNGPFRLPVEKQFIAYSGFFALIAFLFILIKIPEHFKLGYISHNF